MKSTARTISKHMKRVEMVDNKIVDSSTDVKPKSKKKVFIPIIIVVWLLVMGGAAGLAFLLNPEPEEVHTNAIQEAFKFKQDEEKEPTDLVTDVDYYGLYTPNQITLKREHFDDYSKIYGVTGLKSKTVEQKINDRIKNTEVDRLGASYYNVLSLYKYSYVPINEQNTSWDVKISSINFDLNTGDEIKFDDLFVENTNVKSILLKNFYTTIIFNYNHEIETLKYQANYCKNLILANPEGISQKEIDDCNNKVNNLDKNISDINAKIAAAENEAIAKVNNYLKGEKKFYLISSGIVFYMDGGFDSIFYLRDDAKYAAYLKKYRSNESLFEKNNIYGKELITQPMTDLSTRTFKETDKYALDIVHDKSSCNHMINDQDQQYESEIIKTFEKSIKEKDPNNYVYAGIEINYCKGDTKEVGASTYTVTSMPKAYYDSNYRKAVIEGKKNDAAYMDQYSYRRPDINFFDESKIKELESYHASDILIGKSGALYISSDSDKIISDKNKLLEYVTNAIKTGAVLDRHQYYKERYGREYPNREMIESGTYSYRISGNEIIAILTTTKGEKYDIEICDIKKLPNEILIPDLRY